MNLAIFSTHPLHSEVTRALRALGDYREASAPTDKAILAECEGANVIVVRAPIPQEVVRREPGLKALIRHGAGLDMIPVAAATEAGVLVANVPGANALTVAEHAIWTAMALLRRYPQVNADLRAGGWAAGRAHADHGRELSGRSLGIVGMGNIGRILARIAGQGFGMKVGSYSRRPEMMPDGVAAMDLNRLLSDSDILVLACPLTPETRGLIGAAQLRAMRRGAVLINVSRGPIVDESALLEALSSGHLAGAALDVFDTQPLAASHPFMALSNVILTPHMAGITEESMLRMGLGVVDEVRRIAAGELPLNLVNPAAAPAFRRRLTAL